MGKAERTVKDGKRINVRDPIKSAGKVKRTKERKLRNILKHNSFEEAEEYAREYGLRMPKRG